MQDTHFQITFVAEIITVIEAIIIMLENTPIFSNFPNFLLLVSCFAYKL